MGGWGVEKELEKGRVGGGCINKKKSEESRLKVCFEPCAPLSHSFTLLISGAFHFSPPFIRVPPPTHPSSTASHTHKKKQKKKKKRHRSHHPLHPLVLLGHMLRL